MHKHPIFLTSWLMLASIPAQAHDGLLSSASALYSGLLHPWLGLDHLLVLFSTGLYLSLYRPAVRAFGLLSFLVCTLGGGYLAVRGIGFAAIETYIALSLLAAGLLVYRPLRLELSGILLLTALFALGHGYAHGQLWVQHAVASSYLLGFLMSTAAVALLGMAVGAQRKGWRALVTVLCVTLGTSALLGA